MGFLIIALIFIVPCVIFIVLLEILFKRMEKTFYSEVSQTLVVLDVLVEKYGAAIKSLSKNTK